MEEKNYAYTINVVIYLYNQDIKPAFILTISKSCKASKDKYAAIRWKEREKNHLIHMKPSKWEK